MNITEKNTTITNLETGEFHEQTTETITKFPKTADFVMAFTKDLGYMKELTKGEMLVMFGMLKIVNKENEVILNKAVKERICEEFDIKITSIDVLISGLKKKQIILPKARGIYSLQPNLFGKGKWNDIKKLRMVIEWDFKDMTKRAGLEAEYKTEQEILEEQIKALESQKKLIEAKEQKEYKPKDIEVHDNQTTIHDFGN